MAHVTVEGGKSKICGLGRQAGDPGKNDLLAQVRRQSRGRIPSSLGTSVCVLLSPSTDWMRLTYMGKGKLLNSKCTDLNVDLI